MLSFDYIIHINVSQPEMLAGCEGPQVLEVQRTSYSWGPLNEELPDEYKSYSLCSPQTQGYGTGIDNQICNHTDMNFNSRTFRPPSSSEQNKFANLFQTQTQEELLPTNIAPLGNELDSTFLQERKHDRSNSSSRGRTAKNTDKRFQCSENTCTRKFTSKYRLITHVNRFHRPAGLQVIFRCDECCMYLTPYFSALSRHRKSCVKTVRQ
ncbi:hypothetical protein HYPSUDRAFT_1044839 [Hypholoma sublateritium FD-334 SS-4]|uniref:C2H2-type domain-containing protein n=1 Tax=Hypholoma sublateritium (strain FD-334 SS-4) TaxID=945553 RepID=A0A0D2P9U8_HYPSF|nr:hypothetical protein HYPSUDRAFT_1044839 [Hypholoma sublateritium FD-334 SS-4]